MSIQKIVESLGANSPQGDSRKRDKRKQPRKHRFLLLTGKIDEVLIALNSLIVWAHVLHAKDNLHSQMMTGHPSCWPVLASLRKMMHPKMSPTYAADVG